MVWRLTRKSFHEMNSLQRPESESRPGSGKAMGIDENGDTEESDSDSDANMPASFPPAIGGSGPPTPSIQAVWCQSPPAHLQMVPPLRKPDSVSARGRSRSPGPHPGSRLAEPPRRSPRTLEAFPSTRTGLIFCKDWIRIATNPHQMKSIRLILALFATFIADQAQPADFSLESPVDGKILKRDI